MKTVTELPSFQGDLMLRRVDEIPASFEPSEPSEASGDVHILAHSETGHNHVIDRQDVTLLEDPSEPFRAFLQVRAEKIVEHKRSFDTHAPYLLTPGNYEIRRQREYTPEGYRRAAD